jgi:hypothetical protein
VAPPGETAVVVIVMLFVESVTLWFSPSAESV